MSDYQSRSQLLKKIEDLEASERKLIIQNGALYSDNMNLFQDNKKFKDVIEQMFKDNKEFLSKIKIKDFLIDKLKERVKKDKVSLETCQREFVNNGFVFLPLNNNVTDIMEDSMDNCQDTLKEVPVQPECQSKLEESVVLNNN